MRTSEAYYTPEEYITLERKAIPDAEIVRSEYINGKIIGRSSSNWAHNVITGNIVAGLYTRFRNSRCFVFAHEMRVSIPSANSYFYPDVSVVCEEPRLKTMFLIYSSTYSRRRGALSLNRGLRQRRQIRTLPPTRILTRIHPRFPRQGTCRSLRPTGNTMDSHRLPISLSNTFHSPPSNANSPYKKYTKTSRSLNSTDSPCHIDKTSEMVLFFLLQCFWVLGCDVYCVLLGVDGVAGDEGF